MMRRAIMAAAILAGIPSLARSDDLVGRWRNSLGREVDFRQNERIVIDGIGSGSYRYCDKRGGDLCVRYDQYRCAFRATYNARTKVLLLASPRPTKQCPNGEFKRIRSSR